MRVLGTIGPMKEFPLSNFGAHFDRVILDRSREYVLDRRITDIEEISAGEFTAVVEGSEPYLISVSLETRLRSPSRPQDRPQGSSGPQR